MVEEASAGVVMGSDCTTSRRTTRLAWRGALLSGRARSVRVPLAIVTLLTATPVAARVNAVYVAPSPLFRGVITK